MGIHHLAHYRGSTTYSCDKNPKLRVIFIIISMGDNSCMQDIKTTLPALWQTHRISVCSIPSEEVFPLRKTSQLT
jgi:hypothetical protein